MMTSSSSSSVPAWDNEYARLARSASQLRTTGIVKEPTEIATLQQELQNLDTALGNLPLQPTEIQRRRRLIQNLQQQTSTGITTTPLQTQIMDYGVHGGGGGGAMNSSSGNSQQQHQRQTQMTMALRQQDDMINELAVGVGRLKNQTVAIGDEAKLHVNLLNDMETNLDAAHDSLQAQTRRAAQLREDQSVWRLQLIVAALFVLLILLIFLGLTP